MKRSPISRIPSDKQKIENKERTRIHKKLYETQEHKCAQCGRYLEYYQSELSHKKHIGMGGCKDNSVTNEKDCEVTCASWLSGCHPNKEHGLRQHYNEQPDWSKWRGLVQ